MPPEPVSGVRIQLVGNPASGGYSDMTLDRLAEAFAALGATVIRAVSAPGQPLQPDVGADRICVVGGDGTLRHVALALANAGLSIPIAAYPGGTVNLLQRELRLPLDPAEFATRVLRDEAPVTHYGARLDESLFLTCASVGPDSWAVAWLDERLKSLIGRLAYVVAFLRVLWFWPRQTIELVVDGRAYPCEAFYVGKGRWFAGPWSFAPMADPREPVLHVAAFAVLTRWRYVRFMIAMLLRRPVTTVPGITLTHGTRLAARVAAAGMNQVPVQADGDIAAQLPVRMGIAPQALPFVR